MKFQRQRRTKFSLVQELFVKENKGRYECGGYIYSGEGQELGQFWAKLNVGNAKLQKTSSNTSITDDNGITLSLVQYTVSLLIRTARNSLPPLRLMKTETQMLQR